MATLYLRRCPARPRAGTALHARRRAAV